MTRAELIEILERAEEGSRELDIAIFEHGRGWQRYDEGLTDPSGGDWGHWALADIPKVTTNLQDALQLVPEGWTGSVSLKAKDAGRVDHEDCSLWNGKFAPDGDEVYGCASTSPLALCIACLKAQESTEQ